MRLLCWLVLSILLVDSLQKKHNPGATSVSPKITDSAEGSGEDSDSSEEGTEPTTIEKKSSVPILPLDDATDSDEAIDKALSRTTLKSGADNSTYRETPDLEVLGLKSGLETNSHDGENQPRSMALNEDPPLFKSSLYDGKLKGETEDSITLPPNSSEPQEDGKLHSNKMAALDHGKDGAEVDNGNLSKTLDNEDPVLDGKLGKVIHVVVSDLNETTSSTVVDHVHSETSTVQPTTTVPKAPNTTHSQEATSVHETSSPNEESSSPTHFGDASHSSEASTSTAATEPSGSVGDTTTSSTDTSSTAKIIASSENSGKPRYNSMNIDNFDKLDFKSGAEASCESPEACAQNRTELQCLGAYCNEVSISMVTCKPEANLEPGNITSIRYTVPIRWSCGCPDIEPDFQIRNSSVVCEGVSHPGDHWIFQSSCILRFYLDPLMNSSALRGKDHGSSSSAVAIILILFAVSGMGYFVIQAVLLKRRHGHWVPSYCALPLKARMNFRRKRQTNYDEEPVNVHFDMGEEQTKFGGSRLRSYGAQ